MWHPKVSYLARFDEITICFSVREFGLLEVKEWKESFNNFRSSNPLHKPDEVCCELNFTN